MNSFGSSFELRVLLAATALLSAISLTSGFGYDSGEPLPNITQYKVYDVTGLSTTEKRNSGELIHSGLNETVTINQLDQGEYRFSFRITNEGASTWYLNSSDQMFHGNVPDTWNRQQTYYNISTDTFFGGNLSDDRINWDTGQGLDYGNVTYSTNVTKFLEVSADRRSLLTSEITGNISEHTYYEREIYFEGNRSFEVTVGSDEPGYYEGELKMRFQVPETRWGSRWISLKNRFF